MCLEAYDKKWENLMMFLFKKSSFFYYVINSNKLLLYQQLWYRSATPPASHWIQAVNFMGELRTSLQEFKCYYYLVSHCSNQKDKINQLSAQIQLYFECGLISLSYPFTFENHISFQDQINALQKLKLLSSPTVILHFCSQLNLEIIRDDDSLLQPL